MAYLSGWGFSWVFDSRFAWQAKVLLAGVLFPFSCNKSNPGGVVFFPWTTYLWWKRNSGGVTIAPEPSPAVIGPKMSPLTPAGTGFTSKCHSIWKVSIFYSHSSSGWGKSPPFTCVMSLRHFGQHMAILQGSINLLGFLCLYQEPIWLVTRDAYSATQQKLNQFALQWLGKAEVALFA